MAVYIPTFDQDKLNLLNIEVAELCEPFSRRVERKWHAWDYNRNKKIHRRVETVHYPCLLDALMVSVFPGGTVRGPERRKVPGSKPALSIDPTDRLITIERELREWAYRVKLFRNGYHPSRDGMYKGILRRLRAAAPRLEAWEVEELASNVHRWWRWCAKQAGFDPTELVDSRPNH